MPSWQWSRAKRRHVAVRRPGQRADRVEAAADQPTGRLESVRPAVRGSVQAPLPRADVLPLGRGVVLLEAHPVARPGPDSRWVTGAVAPAMSSQCRRPSGAAYGVSMRFPPWSGRQPSRSVIGTITVDMSLPADQPGRLGRREASQSSWSRRSIAISPPHGGTTAPIDGSESIAVARPHAPPSGPRRGRSRPCTPRPRRRTRARGASPTQNSMRRAPAPSTPLEGEVTPIRSPGWRGAGNRIIGAAPRDRGQARLDLGEGRGQRREPDPQAVRVAVVGDDVALPQRAR